MLFYCLSLYKDIYMRTFIRFSIILPYFLFILKSIAQPPAGYYDGTEGLTGAALKIKLHDIISNGFNSVPYDNLPTYYQTTDIKPNGKVWDMYSDIPGGIAPYEFTFSMTCGTFNNEGDCYNREHSVPQSWFYGNYPMYSDLFHVVPTDGYVNNKRSNYPFGDVASASWTSLNGSKLGSSAVTGYSGTVFEPIDSFKGDFARIYFYMATMYKDEIPDWVSDVFTSGDFTTWAKNMFLQWNALDTVSAKERQRNNMVYGIQNNRNPYVDHPEWIYAVWGPASITNNYENNLFVSIFPNPAQNFIHINFSGTHNNPFQFILYQPDGKIVLSKSVAGKENIIDLSKIHQGIYFITVKTDNFLRVEKIVVLRYD